MRYLIIYVLCFINLIVGLWFGHNNGKNEGKLIGCVQAIQFVEAIHNNLAIDDSSCPIIIGSSN